MKVVIAIFAVALGAGLLEAQQQQFDLRFRLSEPVMTSSVSANPFPEQKKSPAVAVLYSLILPGMGELYADAFDEGKYSLIAEGGLWLTYFSFRQYGTWIQRDARNFASARAGSQNTNKDDQYFVNLGNFNDVYEYNEKQLRDRELNKVYDVNSGYYWKWDTDESRREYRAMRVSSERVLNNSQFIIATIVVNRIISAINAARLTRLYNNRTAGDLGTWHLESTLIDNGLKPDGLMLHLVHRF